MALRMKIIVGAIFSCLIVALYSQTYLPSGTTNCDASLRESNCPSEDVQDLTWTVEAPLAVVVPYRDRFEELQLFVPHMHNFLKRQRIQHHIYIVNQADSLRFNRAALINAGFTIVKKSSDYMAMHDVDLLPLNDHLSYAKPNSHQVMHIAAPGLHPKYNYPTFVGGILIIRNEDFEHVNGMSNLYWGWGLEDDEFYVRLKSGDIEVTRPEVTSTKADTFRHVHAQRPRDMARCFDQRTKSRKRDRKTGLKNVNFTLVSTTKMSIEGAPLTVLNVLLICDHQLSPWCDCKNATSSKASKV